MKFNLLLAIIGASFLFTSCESKNEAKPEKVVVETKEAPTKKKHSKMGDDGRISLNLNGMQKKHQLKNMRSHLEAVQTIVQLLAEDNYDEASTVAYEQLGSTTEMKLMCASFGDKNFENLGLSFHSSADDMSEVFKNKNKDESLKALSNTMGYCIQCHATYRQ